MTTKAEIQAWFDAAPEGTTHMIVACDTFDWEDYPVYCESDDETRKRFAELDQVNMQKVMEIYKIELGWEAQSQGRVHNW